jgi:uncharacterized 2Fe-2S/4Fe-4S cluster protein (DUF4445 family)
MEASREGHDKELRIIVLEALSQAVKELDCEGKAEKIVIAGNTTMLHLLQGYSLETMSRHPFRPITLEKEEIILAERKTILLPGISAFVGADILSGLYALDAEKWEKPNLFIDLGTNGEMALGDRKNILCTATAAGPAFEGDISVQLKGTDVIALIGELIQKGIIDQTGLLRDEYFELGYPVKKGYLTQRYIRAIQMAKAAIYTGVESLLELYGINSGDVENVYLAGAFGYHLDTEMAFTIGLLPKQFRGRVKMVGNTSLAGAKKYCMLQDIVDMNRIKQKCSAINLANLSEFDERYLQAINF